MTFQNHLFRKILYIRALSTAWRVVALGLFAVSALCFERINASECNQPLASLASDANASEFNHLGTVFKISDLLHPDKSKNLVSRFPGLVMNSWQRQYAMINQLAPYTIPDPVFGVGEVTVYPVFAAGTELTGGKQIVGHYNSIGLFVNHIRAGAIGSGSSAKLPVFTGPSGTGKTEFLTIYGALAGNLIRHDERHQILTFNWVNLRDHPETEHFAMTDAKGSEVPRPNELGRSPVNLLPAAVQKRLIDLVSDDFVKIVGSKPNIVGDPGPQSKAILEALIQARMRELQKSHLSEKEITDLLENHVQIIQRRFMDDTLFVKLGAQGRDIPYDEIFYAKDALNFTLYGPGSPFSYFYNGSVLRADGGVLALDEYYRNPPALRDAFLDLIEDHSLQRSGSPTVEMDVVIIGATNDPSIEKAKNDGSASAHRDRSRHTPMRLAVHPWEVAKTMLLMQKSDLFFQRKLGPDEPVDAWAPLSFEDAFPLPTVEQPKYVGPKGRYALSVKAGDGGEPIFIAPHTLEYMAAVVAASRFETDPADVQELDNRSGGSSQAQTNRPEAYGVVNSPVFRSPLERLRFFYGESSISPSEASELKSLHYLLKEGSSGISQRDAANIWLREAIDVAARGLHGRTLTPLLARQVFLELLEQGDINYSSTRERLKWATLADQISKAFLVKWLRSDLNSALGEGDALVNRTYDIVYAELLAKAKNPDETQVSISGGKPQPINEKRLREVKQAYLEIQHRQLEPSEIMMFHAEPAHQGRRSPALYEAVQRVIVSRASDFVDFAALADFGRTSQGPADVKSAYSRMIDILIREKGYNEESVMAALSVIAESEARLGQQGR